MPDPIVSKHAKLRGKERAGLNKQALARTAAAALERGLRSEELNGKLRRYIDALQIGHATTLRIHGNHIFAFGRENCLVTVMELPHAHRNAAAKSLARRDRKEASDA